MAFSVLMSLYAKERPDYLRQSFDSVFNQTLPPDEVILVEDGPLTDELNTVLNEYKEKHPELKRIKLPINGGLGKALNEGLKHCSNELVARMDTDDIAKPNRFEKQVQFMNDNSDISVCGSWMEEFEDNTKNIIAIKKAPEQYSNIENYAQSRNPFNHPSVIFQKSAVLASGSYKHFPLFEDYYLWARMIVKGYKMHNLSESLMWFRSSHDLYKRRGGWNYAFNEARFQMLLNKIGLITTVKAYKNIGIRFVVRIMPNFIRGYIYKNLLRN